LKHIHKIIITILSLIVAIFIGWIIFDIGDYYLTQLIERPHHLHHTLWKPGGAFGQGLGILGGGMMVLIFVYSIRKRVRFFSKWGKLPTWLNYHIFLGIAGPILVTFHTAFKFGGLVSISYWSMVGVALSGFIGRYIYIKIPHHVSGKEISRKEFNARLITLTNQFKADFDLSDDTIERILTLSGADNIEKRGLLAIFTIFFMDVTGWLRWRQIKNSIRGSSTISKRDMSHFKQNLRQIVKMDRQIAFWNAAQSLFHNWHVIHKPFAYTMLLIMFIHIAVTVSLGFTWIF